MVKCTIFGCDAEMFQKDFTSHESTCEFKVIRCERCDVVKVPDVECDCVKNISQKYNHLEAKLIKMSQKLD